MSTPTIQVTLVQLDNYGPWTVTPEPRRETDLQSLQARLFADVSRQVGTGGGYVFHSRFDNMIAVTNGLDDEDHTAIQRTVRNQYPVTVSLSVAASDTPAAALELASERLQRVGSAQDSNREEALVGDPLDDEARTAEDVTVAHFDVDDFTSRYTDRVDAFDAHMSVTTAYATLMRYLYRECDALSFFVGGDNIVSICPSAEPTNYQGAIQHVTAETGIELKVGIGRGRTAHEAGMSAKHALEECRTNGTRIERDLATAHGD
ncbi:GTP cyclohydrolase III [Halorientalis brevis]|uniref:GTP cyclohydrolase III n=1 Tax=Halorientalis brevis TaxID=1126241 RepID=A0ABD6CAT0_9EURY